MKGEKMRSRNIRVSIRLNEKGKADLDRKVKLSGLSRNTFLQKLIEDRKILPIPPQPFFDILKNLIIYIIEPIVKIS